MQKKQRLYRPTASRFKDIITPAGKKSMAWGRYREEIIKWTLAVDEEEDGYTSEWMQRGKDIEQEARSVYAEIKGKDVVVPGFAFNREHKCGCYLDGAFAGGAIEIKCPKPANFVKLVERGIVPAIHTPQLQGSLLVTGLDYIDFVGYCPGRKLFVRRVFRDFFYIGKLIYFLKDFNDLLEQEYFACL